MELPSSDMKIIPSASVLKSPRMLSKDQSPMLILMVESCIAIYYYLTHRTLPLLESDDKLSLSSLQSCWKTDTLATCLQCNFGENRFIFWLINPNRAPVHRGGKGMVAAVCSWKTTFLPRAGGREREQDIRPSYRT